MNNLRTATLAALLASLAACGGSDDDEGVDPVGAFILYSNARVAVEDDVFDHALRLADTGDDALAQDVPVEVTSAGSIVHGPAGGEHFSYIAAPNANECSGALRSAPIADPSAAETLLEGCIGPWSESTSSGRAAVSYAPHGADIAARRAVVVHLDQPGTLHRLDTDDDTPGSVRLVGMAGGGSSAAWVDERGTAVARLSGAGAVVERTVVDADRATVLRFSEDGERLVYLDSTRTRLKWTQGSAAGAFLTPAQPAGDTIVEDFVVTPDGSRVLYVVQNIFGLRALRSVHIDAPGVEQRADSADHPLDPFYEHFAVSDDGRRYVYPGVDGDTLRVFVGDMDRPGSVAAASPVGDYPSGMIAFAGSDTVVYVSYDGTYTTLRSVALADTASVLLSSDGGPELDGDDLGVDRFVVCGDGSVVYRMTGEPADTEDREPNWTRLYTATPGSAGSQRALSPRFERPDPQLRQFRCLP